MFYFFITQIGLWMEEADTNNDGVLSYEEFKQSLMMMMIEQRTDPNTTNNNISSSPV